MILIEGTDNSGKTTLGEFLSKELDMELIHSIKPKSKEHAIRLNLDMFSQQEAIFDRCNIIAELVYGPILRGKSIYEEDSWKWVGVLLRHNPIIIYCRPPESEILNFGEREQMGGVIDNASELIRRYDQVMSSILCLYSASTIGCRHFLFHDWTKHNSPELANKLKTRRGDFPHLSHGINRLTISETRYLTAGAR